MFSLKIYLFFSSCFFIHRPFSSFPSFGGFHLALSISNRHSNETHKFNEHNFIGFHRWRLQTPNIRDCQLYQLIPGCLPNAIVCIVHSNNKHPFYHTLIGRQSSLLYLSNHSCLSENFVQIITLLIHLPNTPYISALKCLTRALS